MFVICRDGGARGAGGALGLYEQIIKQRKRSRIIIGSFTDESLQSYNLVQNLSETFICVFLFSIFFGFFRH